jgi:hypothetical protein
MYYLPHDPMCTDDGLALVDFAASPFVEQDKLPVWVNIDIDNLRDE